MSAGEIRPPRLAERILERTLPTRERPGVLGDMAEHYRELAGTSGMRARLWYWRHALETPLRLTAARTRTGLTLHDARYALRALRRSPAFTIVAALSLGLGIGANTAIYSSMRALLYTDMPVERPDELAFVYHERPDTNGVSQFGSGQTTDPVSGATVHSNVSFAGYEAFRAAAPAVDVAGFAFLRDLSFAIADRPAVAGAGLMVSGNFFDTLKVPMQLGRPIGPGADNLGARDEVVISHSFWQREFGGDPEVLSREVRLNGMPFTIVGVTRAGFVGLSPGGFFAPTDLTVALSVQDVLAPRWARDYGPLLSMPDMYWVRVLARLGPEVRTGPLVDTMTAALRAVMLAGGVINPGTEEQARVRLLEAGRGLDSLRSSTESPLRILAFAVGLVLLIACMNVANLLLARGAARQSELAVRRALGASRLRIVRQVFLESLFIAVAGGLAGVVFAAIAGPAITAALVARVGPVGVGPTLDLEMFAITAAVTLGAALLFGTVPALRLSRADVAEHLAGRGSADRPRQRLGRALIAVQIGLSIPLIVGAGLFLRTLGNLGEVDLGFDPERVVIFQVDPELVTDDVDRAHAILRQVVDEIGQVPGIQAASILGNALLSGWVSNGSVLIEEERARMYWNSVAAGTFELLGVTLRSGRPIVATDNATGPPVVVVNETAERMYFDGRALGRSLRWDDRDWEVVGVVADTRYRNVRDAVPPTFFHSFEQASGFRAHVLVRTALPIGQLAPAIRETVAAVDAGLPVTGLRTQQEQVRAAIGRETVFAQALAGFSVFALLLACVGLYGVTSYAVARRRPELGVRIALGAQSQQIVWLVLGQVLALAGFGVVVGGAVSYFMGPAIESMLYGVEAGDPTMLVFASLIMAVTAVGAAWLPARRAARTDALEVLASD